MNLFYHVMKIAVGILAMVAVLSPAVMAAMDTLSIERTFQKAQKDYVEKNMQAAAGQIAKAASYMKAEADKASDKGKQALTASAEELGKLSGDVKTGAVKSQKSLEDAFARAHLALASEAHIRATESWAEKKSVQAGKFLDSAGSHLEKSFAWARQKTEKGTKEVMKKTNVLAMKLKAKGKVVADEVGKGMKEAGDEIEKFGNRISQ